MEGKVKSYAHPERIDNSPTKEEDVERAKTFFSKYYEYLPYNRRLKESVVSVLHSREAGASNTHLRKSLQTNWASSTRKNQFFYMRSLCATKFGSSMQPLIYPLTNSNQSTLGEDKRLRPRQFEYHPSDPSLMAVGTLDGEVIVLNHETDNIVSCISPLWQLNGILGLCWLKGQPSKVCHN